MKYMLLIHQGTTPTPPSEDWENLSEEEKGAVYNAYKALSDTPGVSPGLQEDKTAARDGNHGAPSPCRSRAGGWSPDGYPSRAEGTKESIGGYLLLAFAGGGRGHRGAAIR